MRVTNNMLIRTMMLNLNNNLGRMDKYQQQMATGKKIQTPSDDPIIAARSLKFRTDVSEIEQFQKNTDDAQSWLETSETAIANLGNIAQRIRDLTVQVSNGTMTTDDKQKVKAEISQLKKSIVETGNATYASRYVFAGYKTNKPPFAIETVTMGSEKVEKLTYNGKFLSPGGPVSGSIADTDIQSFYSSNMDKVSGQPELLMGNFNGISTAAPLKFNITLDNSPIPTEVELPAGTYDISNIESALQSSIDTAFGAPPKKIEVGIEDSKIKLTVVQGDSIKISNIAPEPLPADALNVLNLGFVNGSSSSKNEKQEIIYQVGVGSSLDINVEGNEIFGRGTEGIFETFNKLEMAIDGVTEYKTATESAGVITVTSQSLNMTDLIADVDKDIDRLLKARADVGARCNFVELTQNRLEDDLVNFTGLMSKNEDADMAEVIMNLKNEENVYRASLSAGAKVIQPTLLDFLR